MKRKAFKYPPVKSDPLVLRDRTVEDAPMIVNVRAAKDQFSNLLEYAASGTEVIITSDGRPKAKLVPVRARRPVFRTDWKLLRSMPLSSGDVQAEAIIRTERDGRA